MEHWNTYWSSTHYPPVVTAPPAAMYGGTNTEPLASIGMSCFLDAVREDFKEGFKVLDYGCGAGILGNFISARLQNFTYYGLEPNTLHGNERIGLAKQCIDDKRFTFGHIETDFDLISKQELDTIVLISIFTHMTEDDISTVLDSLQSVFSRNPKASIVFSCFIDQESRVETLQSHIWERFYGRSFITSKFLTHYCSENNLKLTHHMDFVAQGGHVHSIIKINKI